MAERNAGRLQPLLLAAAVLTVDRAEMPEERELSFVGVQPILP
jgi:hypothetical protein